MALKRESAGLAGEDNNGQKRRLAQLLPFIKEMKLTLSLSVTTVKTEPVKEIVRFRCCFVVSLGFHTDGVECCGYVGEPLGKCVPVSNYLIAAGLV